MIGTSNENFQRGVSALQAGNLKEAKQFLQAVVRAEPRYIPALICLAWYSAGSDATATLWPATIEPWP